MNFVGLTRTDRIVSLLIAVVSLAWSQVVYWKWIDRNKENRSKNSSLDGWTIYAEMKKVAPRLASRWVWIQLLGVFALVYFFLTR